MDWNLQIAVHDQFNSGNSYLSSLKSQTKRDRA